MALIEREPCYIYSMREYQEHSLILEAISLNLGAIAILARGAKRPDSPLQGLFQPFTPLLLSLQLGQKGDLYYLKDYEYCPGGYHFVIPESFCAFYLNELLHLLYHGKESDKLLFGHYIATLEAIEHKDNIEHHLRSFELHLLKSLGYAISPLDEQGDPVKADQSYRFCFGIGFVEVDPEFMAQVMRSQSQKTTAAPAPVPQPETGADNAMLFAKSKIRGPKMAESRPSQAPGQEAWVKRALEQGFSSSVIQRYYEYGADLLGPILTGAEIQDIVSLECKLPHSAHNAKLLTASVINRLTGGVELNSRKLYREYLHLCKQKQAAALAPAPTAPKAAPAPAPAVATAATPAPTQVVAPMAPAPQPAASAVAAPAPSTVPTKPQVTAPVASAAPEVNPAPVASLETSATTAESESEAYVEPEANQAPEASLETSATATEGESEVPVEPEANPVPVTSLETAELTVETEQGAGADESQSSQDETVVASPELETEATSSLETSTTASKGEGEAPAELEATPAPVASLETVETEVKAEPETASTNVENSEESASKASKKTKSAKAASAKGRKTSSAQATSAKRKTKPSDLTAESDPAVITAESEEVQASESTKAPAKPKRSTKAKSGKGTKSTSAKGTKAKTSSKRSARQRAAVADIAGTVESSQQEEPEPEVITQGPEIEALDDELLVLAPQVIEPEVSPTPVKVKKVKKLTKSQLKAKAKAEADARALAEQERMATSPYDESMLMTLDASLNRRRRKKPLAQ